MSLICSHLITVILTSLTSKAVEGPALPLQGVDGIHSGDAHAASVLHVGNSVANHSLEEDLEDAASLLVDEAADALHSPMPCKPSDGGLGYALILVSSWVIIG